MFVVPSLTVVFLCLHEECFAFCALLRTNNTKKERSCILSKFTKYMQSWETYLRNKCCTCSQIVVFGLWQDVDWVQM